VNNHSADTDLSVELVSLAAVVHADNDKVFAVGLSGVDTMSRGDDIALGDDGTPAHGVLVSSFNIAKSDLPWETVCAGFNTTYDEAIEIWPNGSVTAAGAKDN